LTILPVTVYCYIEYFDLYGRIMRGPHKNHTISVMDLGTSVALAQTQRCHGYNIVRFSNNPEDWIAEVEHLISLGVLTVHSRGGTFGTPWVEFHQQLAYWYRVGSYEPQLATHSMQYGMNLSSSEGTPPLQQCRYYAEQKLNMLSDRELEQIGPAGWKWDSGSSPR
jgi:hypothetical protein